MMGFVRGAFEETSSYTALEYCIYCALLSLTWLDPLHHTAHMYCVHCAGAPCIGGGTRVYAYERGEKKGVFGAFGLRSVLEIRLTPENEVQYVDDGHVFYTSSRLVSWPLHVAAALNTVQEAGFIDVQYLSSLPPAPPAAVSPPPADIGPPPPLPPGDYVLFDGGASADLATSPGAVSRPRGNPGWNAAAWSSQDIWSPHGDRKGISFRCPITTGGKMMGFRSARRDDAFEETSSYTALEYCIYCVLGCPSRLIGTRLARTPCLCHAWTACTASRSSALLICD